MKKETIRKRNTGIGLFDIILDFKNKYEKNVFTYAYSPPYGIPLYLRNVVYSKKIGLYLILVKQLHTFVLLNMFCQYIVFNVYYMMSRKTHCNTNEISTINISFSGSKYIFIGIYMYTRSMGQ